MNAKNRMNTKNKKQRIALGIAASALFAGTAALADDDTVVVSTSAPEKTSGLYNAFEVGVGLSYSQGAGDVGRDIRSLTDTADAGAAVELDLGWRINPNWLVGVYGSTAWYSTGNRPGDAHNNWSTTAGLQGNYHFLPGQSLDPWIGFGAGWRGYWINRPEGRDSRHGIDFARAQVGLDVPVTSGVTISPFVGATATVFLTQQLAQESSFSNISNPNVNVFVNVGVMGRFDVLGSAR